MLNSATDSVGICNNRNNLQLITAERPTPTMAQHIEEAHISWESKREIINAMCDEAKALLVILIEAPEEFLSQFRFNNNFSCRRFENYLIYEGNWKRSTVLKVMGDMKKAHERFITL